MPDRVDRPLGDPQPPGGRRVFETVIVTSARCHMCDDAKALLADLQTEYPLVMREVDMASDEGLRLARRFGMPFPPLLVIDGSRFGHGRISRRKLTRHLDQEQERRGT